MKTLPEEVDDPPLARKRRSRAEVLRRIHEAARDLFAERGYAGTTTKEIARRAEASETLLFRYYGGKAALFEEVITTPLNAMMAEFVRGRSHPDRSVNPENFTGRVFLLLQRNRELLAALLSTLGQGQDGPVVVGDLGLGDYFAEAAAQIEAQHRAAGREPDLDANAGVRLGFGMIVASVLFRDWLFGGDSPSDEHIGQTLRLMIGRGLGPPAQLDQEQH